MAFPNASQGYPDGQGISGSTGYFTVNAKRYGMLMNGYRYGWDESGAGAYSDKSIGQFVGIKFYAENDAAFDAGDEAANMTSRKDGIRNGLVANMKIEYQLPGSTAYARRRTARKAQTRILIPTPKVEEFVASGQTLQYYDKFDIKNITF